jgi:hypothetical protein
MERGKEWKRYERQREKNLDRPGLATWTALCMKF